MVERKKRKRGPDLLMRILIGLALGAAVGLIVGPKIVVIKPFGTLFVRLLMMTVMPLVFFSIVAGSSGISPARLGRVGVKIFLYYLTTTAFAATIGLLLGKTFHPGLGLSLAKTGAKVKPAHAASAVDTLLNIVPKNPFASLSTGSVLPIIFFAIVFGIGIAYLKESKDEQLRHGGEILFAFFDGGFHVMIIIAKWVLEYAPIGVFALIAVVLGTQGSKVVGPLAFLTLLIYSGYAIQFFGVYGGIVSIFKLNFFKLLSKNINSMLAVFVTRSGGATLPLRMQEADEKMGIPKAIYSFTLPLGAVMNMDGGAIYMGISTLFIAFAAGIHLTSAQLMAMVLAATLSSIGAASIPGGSAIMELVVLGAVGLNVGTMPAVAAGYAMVLGIDAILDMGRSVVNCEGDLIATTVITKSEGELDLKAWN